MFVSRQRRSGSTLPGRAIPSTTVEAPVTTSLPKDDTIVQGAMCDDLTGTISVVLVEGRTPEVRPQRPIHSSVQGRLAKRLPYGIQAVAICGNMPASSLRLAFFHQTMFRHSEAPNSFRELLRSSSRHCA